MNEETENTDCSTWRQQELKAETKKNFAEKIKTQEQESEEMQIKGSMTLSSSSETITERHFFLIEPRLSLLLQHTIKTLIYAETSSYTHTKAQMTVDTKEKKITSKEILVRT